MKAKDLVFDQSSQRKPVEQFIDSHKDRFFVIGVLFQLFCALILESKVDIDLTILVVAPNQMYLFGIDTLQRQKQADGFDRVASPVHKVPQEDIVKIFDIFFLPIFMRGPIKCKETHQICKLPMDIPKDLQRRFGLQDHRLTNDDFLCYIAKSDNLLRLESKLYGLGVHVVVRLHQDIEESMSDIQLAVQGS